MRLKQQIDQDLKQAMLAGNKTLVTTLRGLKGAILNVEIIEGSREQGLSDEKITALLAKEAKKRQESADLYVQGGSQERADAELTEKKVIEAYLPAQLSEEDIKKLVDEAVAQTGATTPQQMGQVIGVVKQKAGASADGGVIARLVKERLAQ
jgi:uncharacterized protein YqeY